MKTNQGNRRPLMGTDNILELQENGYKSTVSAICEIIDNSIQANSKNIDVVIIKNNKKQTNEIDEILIIDDGEGMSEEVFQKALQMSSGTRTRATHGLGKYGQGLPNASISQTKRVEVYTKQKNQILFDYIDLQEIYESGEPFLPEIEFRETINIPIFETNKLKLGKNGTIVRWVEPNRLNPKTAKTLSSHLEQIAGRIFKYYINGFTDQDGKFYQAKINIIVFDSNGKNFEFDGYSSKKNILPFDPMFLMEKTQMNSLFPQSNHPTSQKYGHEIKKVFKVETPDGPKETTVEIIISYCKKEERLRYGSNAGSTDFGKKYHRRNYPSAAYNNISIIRSGREIDSGHFGFLNDFTNTTNRWWSAEVIVSPIIDSIVGIDNKKQQASNIRYIDKSEVNDTDTHEIILWISTFLWENIRSVYKEIEAQNAGVRKGVYSEKNDKLPAGGVSEPGTDPTAVYGTKFDNEAVQSELFKWIKERYPTTSDNELLESTKYALNMRDSHIFIKSDLGDTQLYSYKVFGNKVLIEINYNHSFYKRFIQNIEEKGEDDKTIRSIRLLIGALVNAEILSHTEDKELIKDRRNLRNRMAESLDDYIEDLYKGN